MQIVGNDSVIEKMNGSDEKPFAREEAERKKVRGELEN
jgi:hypothetical protein